MFTRSRTLRGIWRIAIASVLMLLVSVLVQFGSGPAVADTAATTTTVADRWSPVGYFRTPDGWYASPIHAALMPDGRVFFIGIAWNANPPESATASRRIAWIFTPPPPGTDPATNTVISPIAEPVLYDRTVVGNQLLTDDFFCAGLTLDAQGRVVTAGGTRGVQDATSGKPVQVQGLPYETILNNSSWQVARSMIGAGPLGGNGRWYPTLTRLPDGTIMVTGGFESLDVADVKNVVGSPNRTAETWSTASGAQAVVSDLASTPDAIRARDYTHVFLLPYSATNDLLLFGESGVPIYASTARTNSMTATNAPRPQSDAHTNYGTSSAMLPIRLTDDEWGYHNGSVLLASGDMGTVLEHSADVFDPVTGSWLRTLDLATFRHHPSTVLLPDSRVLVIDGHDMDNDPGVTTAQYVDPRQGFAVSSGSTSSGVVRGYHSVALLLPDGRVLVGGGRDQQIDSSKEKPSYQIYNPSYVSQTRPAIRSAPTSLSYGRTFSMHTSGAAPTELMLMGLGAMTHSIDMNQRAIQVKINRASKSLFGSTYNVSATAPADSHIAPPGYYVLYALDANHVPSAGSVIRIS